MDTQVSLGIKEAYVTGKELLSQVPRKSAYLQTPIGDGGKPVLQFLPQGVPAQLGTRKSQKADATREQERPYSVEADAQEPAQTVLAGRCNVGLGSRSSQ